MKVLGIDLAKDRDRTFYQAFRIADGRAELVAAGEDPDEVAAQVNASIGLGQRTGRRAQEQG